MKGAALSRRRTAPPHFSQVVRGAAEIRCFSSNTRPHFRHSYSYVGTNLNDTWACRIVSRLPEDPAAALGIPLAQRPPTVPTSVAGLSPADFEGLARGGNHSPDLQFFVDQASTDAVEEWQLAQGRCSRCCC